MQEPQHQHHVGLLLQAAHAGLTFSQFQTSHMFQVVTYTSDLRGAGSEATVFARLRGEQGTSPRCSLIPADREASSFSRGQKDVFQLQLPELGTLQSLTIGRLACMTLLHSLAPCCFAHPTNIATTSTMLSANLSELTSICLWSSTVQRTPNCRNGDASC